VTGIVEKKHYRESISYAQLISPNIERVGVIGADNLSNQKNVRQIKKEMSEFSTRIIDIKLASSLAQATSEMRALEAQVDAFFLLNPSGILDSQGRPIEGEDALSLMVQATKKPTIGHSSWHIQAGALCGVVKTGQEQGVTSARMAQKVLGGRPTKDLPITQNCNGQRMINVTTAEQLGIPLKPMVLVGTQLVR
jgi:ABC-type uncharacterized transport system substrate-binding protein